MVFTAEDVAAIVAALREQVTDEETPVARRALMRLVRRVDVGPAQVRIAFAEIDLGAVVAGYDGMPPRGFALYPAKRYLVPLLWANPIDIARKPMYDETCKSMPVPSPSSRPS